ncbi:hypothetical protein A4X13_0g4922 [Tilletia indica]|uniref:6-phosphogluconolactonase n=1 Tax=Tilletia indica TaxID=43049 RepID=A0A177TTL2_9BASI|nr:hypothetical protein A4X13_0g4922 [Tilletia indica]
MPSLSSIFLTIFAISPSLLATTLVNARPLSSPLPRSSPPEQPLRFYISGYDKNIRQFDFQPGVGAKQVGIFNVGGPVGPSWLEYRYDSDPASPNGRRLSKVYATDGGDHGRVLAFDVDNASGNLNFKQEGTTGAGPVTVTTVGGSRGLSCLITADYGGGSVTVHDLASQDGAFNSSDPLQAFQFNGSGPVTSRQDRSYAHQAIVDPSGRFLYAVDLGTDQIHVISIPTADKTKDDEVCSSLKVMDSIQVAAGSGPRHVAFHKSPSRGDTYVYLASELANTITAFQQDSQSGQLRQIGEPILVLPPGTTFPGYSETAPNVGEVVTTADGKFVLISTRNSPDNIDHIAVFSRCEHTGQLTWLDWYPTEGKTVRHFSLSPDAESKYVLAANSDSNSAMIFSRDPISGALKKETLVTDLDKPNFARFV